MKSPLLLFLLPFAFLLVQCARPKAPEYLGFENLHLRQLGMSESVLAANLKYYNPNPYQLQLAGAELDVFFNSKLVGHSSLDTLIRIPRLDTFLLPVALRVNSRDLAKNAIQLLLNPEVILKVSGNARLGKAGIYKNFPLDYETKQNLESLLKDTSISKLFR